MNARASVFIGVVLVLSSLAGAQYLGNKCCKDTTTSPCAFTNCILVDGHWCSVTSSQNVKMCQTATNPFLLAVCDDNRPEALLKQNCASCQVYTSENDCQNSRMGYAGTLQVPGCTDSCK
jgi:hypothetical protein